MEFNKYIHQTALYCAQRTFNKNIVDLLTRGQIQPRVLIGKLKTDIQQLNREVIEKSNTINAKNEEIQQANAKLKQCQDEIRYLKEMIFALKKDPEKVQSFNIEDYQADKVIGQGAVAIVTKVVGGPKKDYAKKELKLFDQKTLQRFMQEGEILFTLRHPCIIRIHGFNYGDADHSPSILLSMEPTSLETSIQNHELNNFDKNRIVVEIVLGMRYIHQQKLMHRDLKPENILLSKNKHVRISDFGLAKKEDLGVSQSKGVGTLRFMAPELFEEQDLEYTNKVDVYAFGMILLYVLAEQYPPFSLLNIMESIPADIMSKMVNWVVVLIESCLAITAEDRPSFDEIFSILKSHDFDLFRESTPTQFSSLEMKNRDDLRRRILKIQAFEFQNQK